MKLRVISLSGVYDIEGELLLEERSYKEVHLSPFSGDPYSWEHVQLFRTEDQYVLPHRSYSDFKEEPTTIAYYHQNIRKIIEYIREHVRSIPLRRLLFERIREHFPQAAKKP